MRTRLFRVLLPGVLLLGFGVAVLRAQGTDAPAVVNVNTATEQELERLPRIGPALAKRIVAYRKAHGPFKKVEDLMQVKGIGEATFAGLKDRITVGPEGAAAQAAAQ